MATRARECARLLDDARDATRDDDVAAALRRVATLASAPGGESDAAETSELNAIVERAIEFGRDARATTREAAASACETLGKAREGWLAACARTLGEMTRDESAATAKRASAGVGALFREALIVSAVKGNATRVVKTVKDAWSAAREAIDGGERGGGGGERERRGADGVREDDGGGDPGARGRGLGIERREAGAQDA